MKVSAAIVYPTKDTKYLVLTSGVTRIYVYKDEDVLQLVRDICKLEGIVGADID